MRTIHRIVGVVGIVGSTAMLALAGVTPVSSALAQQPYPNKPVRFITPYAAGGAGDIMARLIAPKLSENLGQPVVVDARPGGNTIIGSELLVKSRPDGYTIMLATNTHVLNALLLPKLPYDTIKDFAPVAIMSSSDLVLVVHPSIPVGNLQELLALARSKPGQLTYATASGGGSTHLAAEQLSIAAGIKMQHIPYKGSGPALVDLVGGQVNLYFSAPLSINMHVKNGRLKAIAITGATRSPVLPDVPTFTEVGLPAVDTGAWYGIVAPAGTPKDILGRLASEVGNVVNSPDLKEKLATQGMKPLTSTPDGFAALINADMAKYARLIKAANIKLDD